mmetsp:Transcript_67781/g.177737  ORF Transcript_67781/g.177737 Transcript_67781/m.177737 type:complete len:286 (-) Transcript_67781:258-1115(-)
MSEENGCIGGVSPERSSLKPRSAPGGGTGCVCSSDLPRGFVRESEVDTSLQEVVVEAEGEAGAPRCKSCVRMDSTCPESLAMQSRWSWNCFQSSPCSSPSFGGCSGIVGADGTKGLSTAAGLPPGAKSMADQVWPCLGERRSGRAGAATMGSVGAATVPSRGRTSTVGCQAGPSFSGLGAFGAWSPTGLFSPSRALARFWMAALVCCICAMRSTRTSRESSSRTKSLSLLPPRTSSPAATLSKTSFETLTICGWSCWISLVGDRPRTLAAVTRCCGCATWPPWPT